MLSNDFIIKHRKNTRNFSEGMDLFNRDKITFCALYELFDELQRTQGACQVEHDNYRRTQAKPVNLDEKTVKMTIEVPYSAINIDEDSIEFDCEKDPGGYEVTDLNYDGSSTSIDNVNFDIVDINEEEMDEFAIYKYKRGMEE